MAVEAESSFEKDVAMAVRRFSIAFGSFDAEGVVATLDPGLEEIVYQAEERWTPLMNRADIENYIRTLGSKIRRFDDIKVVDFSVRKITAEVASVYMRSWCRIIFRASGVPLDGQVRQSFTLRNRARSWWITDYHESRQFPGLESVMGEASSETESSQGS